MRRLIGAMRRMLGPPPAAYAEDGLVSSHDHDFVTDPRFIAAYARGIAAAGEDYRWRWRVHVALWVARTALGLSGDFIEFGVNRGFLASAIMHDLDWNRTGRTFYLLDTFSGIDPDQLSDAARAPGAVARNRAALDGGFYTTDLARVEENFAEWTGARIIQGRVPDSLQTVDSHQFAFASIDMNCAAPEVAAISFVWDRLVAGALILLDDYAYQGYGAQKAAMDGFAASKGVSILSLPTGQGLIVKPG